MIVDWGRGKGGERGCDEGGRGLEIYGDFGILVLSS